MEIKDYKPEKFELETLKSEKVELKPLPNPPKPDIKQILLYLKQVIENNYDLRSIVQAFEIARETSRQMGVSSTTTHQTKIWEMSKYANIYLKKESGFGLPTGRGLSMTLLCSTYIWSVGVMEHWKNENPTPIFCNFKQKTSRISDAKSL